MMRNKCRYIFKNRSHHNDRNDSSLCVLRHGAKISPVLSLFTVLPPLDESRGYCYLHFRDEEFEAQGVKYLTFNISGNK